MEDNRVSIKVEKNSNKRIKKSVVLTIVCVCVLCIGIVVTILCLNKSDSKSKKQNNTSEKSKNKNKESEVKKQTIESLGLKNEKIVSNEHTFDVKYTPEYYDDITIGVINVTITNENGDNILQDDCYNLGNPDLYRFMVNSDDTITTLRSDGTDDPSKWIVETLDFAGNKIDSKKVITEQIGEYFDSDLSKYYYNGAL